MFKKSNLTKQQKEAQKQREREQQRVNKRVNDEIFPLLKELCPTIDEAEIMPAVLEQVIQQALLNKQKDMLLKDLGLIELLNVNVGEKSDNYKKLILMIENENINTALDILGGIAKEIQFKEKIYWKGKSLSDLYVIE